MLPANQNLLGKLLRNIQAPSARCQCCLFCQSSPQSVSTRDIDDQCELPPPDHVTSIHYIILYCIPKNSGTTSYRLQFLPREATQSAVTPSKSSVCLSVTLLYCDHIGWNSSKIISRLVSLGFLLSADPNITDLFQWEYPQILLNF